MAMATAKPVQLFSFITVGLMALGINQPAIAQALTCDAPTYANYSIQDFQERNIQVISSDNANPKVPSTPSFWWAQEKVDHQFKGNLITGWRAYPDQGHVDLIIGTQLWSLLGYLERYRTINSFGHIVKDYGYSLRILNQESTCLALYTCEGGFCQIDFQGSGNDYRLSL